MKQDPSTPTNTGHPLRSFRERNVRIFFGGIALSNAGTWAQLTTVVLLIRQLGGGGVELGIVTAAQFLPLLLLGLYAGAVADRIDRFRRTMELQALMGLLAVALGIIDLADRESIPVLYAITFAFGFLNAFDNPTRRTFITEMVPKEDLANVLSLSTSVMTGSGIFGPLIAGLVVSVAGTAWVFLLNGVSYLAFLIAMSSMDSSAFHPIERAERSATPVRDGLREVWADPILRITMLVFALIATFAFTTSVGFPLLVTERLGEEDDFYFLLISTLSIGNVVGSLLVARLVVVSHRFMYIAGAGLAIALGAFSLATSGTAALLLCVPLGITLTSFLNSSNIIVQQRTRPEIRSRVLALVSVVFLGSTPIGGPITGVIGDAYGAVWANMYGAIVAGFAIVVGLLLLRRVSGSFNPVESLQS